MVLNGFTGNGSSHFNPKFNETPSALVIDSAFSRGEAPEALYVFVDAMTSWGGSQFINSAASGKIRRLHHAGIGSGVERKISCLKKCGGLSV